MGNNFTDVTHLKDNPLPNKEAGHAISSMSIKKEEEKEELNYSGISKIIDFVPKENFPDHIKATQETPTVSAELQAQQGVIPISNPTFSELAPIPDNESSPTQEQILKQIKEAEEEVKKAKHEAELHTNSEDANAWNKRRNLKDKMKSYFLFFTGKQAA